MIKICTMIWDPNDKSFAFSRMYDESWVDRLNRGFQRNTSLPFEFVVYTDRIRDFEEPCTQLMIRDKPPSYGAYIQPFELDTAMVLVGLDTVVTGNVDPLLERALRPGPILLPRDPFFPHTVCNGVAVVPAGKAWLHERHRGENDMDYLRNNPHLVLDDEMPGLVHSYKGHVRQHGLGDTRIVYFHGEEKPHELGEVDWIAEHWK